MVLKHIIERFAFAPPNPNLVNNHGPPITYVTSSEGDLVSILLIKAEQNKQQLVILYSHGNAEDLGLMREPLSLLSKDLGVDVVCYDYPGYGSMEMGKFRSSERKTYLYAETAYNWITKTLGVPEQNIILLGRSIGGGPTVHLACQKPAVRGVILQSVFLSIVRVVFPFLSLDGLGDIFINQNKICHVQAPILFVHGTRDGVVPIHHSKELYERYKECRICQFEPVWIKGAGHNDISSDFRDVFLKAIRNFINQTR